MTWLYAKTAYDDDKTYQNFIHIWGFVLSMLPPAYFWWAWRLGELHNLSIVILLGVLTYGLTFLIYHLGILQIDRWSANVFSETIDDDDGDIEKDFYNAIIRPYQRSIWSMNPVYVLKQRYCPDLSGHEIHKDVQCWPERMKFQGFVEIGKSFRHFSRSSFLQNKRFSYLGELKISDASQSDLGSSSYQSIPHTWSFTSSADISRSENRDCNDSMHSKGIKGRVDVLEQAVFGKRSVGGVIPRLAKLEVATKCQRHKGVGARLAALEASLLQERK